MANCTLRADFSGCLPMFDSFASLAEALQNVEFNGPDIELESGREGVALEGNLLAKLVHSGLLDGVLRVTAVPTVHLPLFVTAMQAGCPALRVEWRGGWPFFSARPHGDDRENDTPPVLTPDNLVPA